MFAELIDLRTTADHDARLWSAQEFVGAEADQVRTGRDARRRIGLVRRKVGCRELAGLAKGKKWLFLNLIDA